MKIFLLFFSFFALFTQTYAIQIWENTTLSNENTIRYDLDIAQEVWKEISEALSINTEYNVDLRPLEEKLKILSPESRFEATWDILWASSQTGFQFQRMFKEKWVKYISLNIYKTTDFENEWTLSETISENIYSKDFKILVYEKSILLIFSDQIHKAEIDNYTSFSENEWTYIYKVWPLSKTDIELNSIINSIENYSRTTWLQSDYVTIWWDRDFIFDILSKLNREVQSNKDILKNSLHIVGISPYNIEILQNYLWNFLAKKDWIASLLLMSEEWKYLVLKQNQIIDFKTELEKNQHQFVDVALTNEWISQLLFISNFVNNLSNLWYTTENIYIFLILPAILAGISFFKHFVGFSPIGVIIPLFLTVLFFKLGYLATLVLISLYVGLNLLISFVTEKYNLLYTPKVGFVLTLNIIVFIMIFNLFSIFNIIPLDLWDIIYFITFIIISEKIINIILSKDILEYTTPFISTLVIASLCFVILNIDGIKLLTLAYPELILWLIPLNFLLWRFTGLRITEYFRFKEIIKSVEEE